ncbi:MAG: hypothetical protein U0W40_18310 [Acidimicrobiia bacterium]
MAGQNTRERHHRLGFVVTAVLLALAAGVFVTLRGAVRDLDRSLDRFYDRTNFAVVTTTGGDAARFAQEAAAVPGVTTVQQRGNTTLSIWADDGARKLQGTVLGVPADGPSVSRPVITAGTDIPEGSTEPVAVVEQHTADDLGIQVGDTLTALGPGTPSPLKVVGIGLSPEYLLPAQSQQQIVSSPGSFAIVFVPQPVAEQLGGPATVPQVLVASRADDTGPVIDKLRALAHETGAELVVVRDNQPSNALIDEERTGFVEASFVIPLLAFLTAMFVAAVACARVDDTKRRHLMMVRTTVIGALSGVGLGLIGAAIVGPKLTRSVSIPNHFGASHLLPALGALGLTALAGLAAFGLGSLLLRGTGRSLGGGPAIVSGLAAAAAMVMIVGPLGVVDSAQATLDAAARLEPVDAQIAFVVPATADQLASVEKIPGVIAAEPVPSANVYVRHGDRRYATQLQAFPENTTMQTFETPQGKPQQLPADGVLIPESLGKLLDAKPGDVLELELPGAGVQTMHIPVAAYTSNTLGNLVFMHTSTLRDALGPDANAFAGGLFTTATLRYAPGADADAIAAQVQKLPSVVVYVPVGASLGSIAAVRPIFDNIIRALIILGVVVAALGVGGAVLLQAHTRVRHGVLKLVLEVLGALLVGILLGSVVGARLADALLADLNTELVHLMESIDTTTYLLAAGLVLVVGAGAAVIGGVRAGRSPGPPSS